ncbi:uncharacterized protein LOC106644359 [Copidosoma floridanum]|uniref:uncharacterized protein LOC106644359 n=1 Tax=Copidosoma floridanum TaxID=29053 RepID=UPI000C6FB12B|nr:uncharacterized protein LOC106644359 [Copidosoma floridanum]
MTKKLPRFEKYSVAPSPSRDYYGLKVLGEQVILYIWKITHGPHLSPITRTTSLPDFPEDKVLKDEISFAFGPRVLNHIENLTSRGSAALLTLPNRVIERLVRYLSLNDVASLLRVSRQSNEIFASNAIWEVLYKRLKGTSKLLAMERELGSSQGFKKLARSQHVRATAKKSSSQTASSSRAEPLVPRSASVSLAESTYRVLPGKQSKLPRALLAGAGESYELHPVIVNEGRAAGKIGKTRVAEEERKKYLKSLMFESETGGGSKEAIERRTPGTKSPRSRFKRRAPGGTRSKSIGRATGKGSAKKPASDVKEWRASDDSDDSGMSYLMKRYLQTSDEVGRKFDACGRMARSTRDSGVQVDLAKSGSVGRKPVGKIAAPVTPTSRGAVPTRLKTLKKT